MKREFLTTGDGSVTIRIPEWDEQYHSKHGAIAEAEHVFIAMGLHHLLDSVDYKEINVMEVGFGTGLNAFLTFLDSGNLGVTINYTGIEAYPVTISEIEKLNYPELLNASESDFLKFHESPWEISSEINSKFALLKRKQLFSEIEDIDQYHLIYFDAFGARVQPELWTEAIFKKMYDALKPGGILVTYSSKGSVRRAMLEVGFEVERLPGPPGKRQMLRAVKTKS